ncbi:enoyl-CoA hydratase-related protein [Streptomyces sp. TS71-3]|uniref:enoyl-CoA hydratase-related protein n=1 Tax=Streptomyces sp. TS71-3 TaxID=2733862 RepID=UPI001B0561E7|nr:enoyl-CoA hydratase-related protein [Streptomyces sp. TS71-3]GHJ38699.1 enoyl-CoA hydratase [Streptomyces sp. TS71-3]
MTLHYSTKDHIASVVIDRPPVNALDDDTYRELAAAFTRITDDQDVRAATLTSAGTRAFCGGTDIHSFSLQHPEDPGYHERHSRLVREAFSAIYRCRVPVVAGVQAAAVGAGVGLLGSVDLVVAAEDAVFRLPEIDVGVLGGARHLARLVPEQLVRYLAYTGTALTAADLQRVGGACRVVASAELADAVLGLATTLAEKSPAALPVLKRGLNHIELSGLNVEEGYRYEQTLTGSLADHPHARESARAFFEKRKPDYA